MVRLLEVVKLTDGIVTTVASTCTKHRHAMSNLVLTTALWSRDHYSSHFSYMETEIMGKLKMGIFSLSNSHLAHVMRFFTATKDRCWFCFPPSQEAGSKWTELDNVTLVGEEGTGRGQSPSHWELHEGREYIKSISVPQLLGVSLVHSGDLMYLLNNNWINKQHAPPLYPVSYLKLPDYVIAQWLWPATPLSTGLNTMVLHPGQWSWVIHNHVLGLQCVQGHR